MTSGPRRGRWARAALVLAALGATLGTALDAIHTHAGATAYARPALLRAAWWVPALFGGAFTLGLLRPLGERVTGRLRPPPAPARAALAMALFAAAYAASVLPLPWPAVAALLAAIFLAGWRLCDGTPVTFAVALGAAIGGPLFESALVARGAFLHLHPAFLGVSGWLPTLYLCAAVGLCCLGKRLVDA